MIHPNPLWQKIWWQKKWFLEVGVPRKNRKQDQVESNGSRRYGIRGSHILTGHLHA